jgi:hypothetical protein
MEYEDVVELVLPRVEAVRRLLVHVHLQLHLNLLSCTQITVLFTAVQSNVADPDPNPSDPYVFGPPGSESGSVGFESGSVGSEYGSVRSECFCAILDLNPDPLVRGLDTDPSIIEQK